MAAHSSCDHPHDAAGTTAKAGGSSPVLRLVAGLGLLTVVPFLAGRLLYNPAVDGSTRLWTCPLLEATGVPCPACGATRSFVYFAQGDARFLDYNWMWLLIWGGLVAVLLLLLIHRLRERGRRSEALLGTNSLLGRAGSAAAAALRGRTWLAVALPFSLLIPAWLVALANVDAISAGIR